MNLSRVRKSDLCKMNMRNHEARKNKERRQMAHLDQREILLIKLLTVYMDNMT